MLTSHVQRPPLTTVGKVGHTEVVWGLWVRCAQCWGWLWASRRGPQVKPPKESLIRLVGSAFTWCFILSPGCCPLSHSVSPSYAALNSVSWWGWETMSYTAREDGCSYDVYALAFLCGRYHRSRSSLSALSCAAWGRGDVEKVKPYLLSHQCIQSWGIFVLTVCWHFSDELSDFHEGHLSMGDGWNQCSLWGRL